MSKSFCTPCGFEHDSISWKHCKWDGVEGWGCNKYWNDMEPTEFTSNEIKEGRRTYAKELLQPYRAGEFSKEYRDAYPEQSRQMVKEGVITEKQHNNAKEVWKKDIY